MGLFSSRKNEFSGRPIDNTTNDPVYMNNETSPTTAATTSPNTLHKKQHTLGSNPDGTLDNTTIPPQKRRTGLFGRRKNGSVGTSSDEERFDQPGVVGGMNNANAGEFDSRHGAPMAGATGLGATGAGVATGGAARGSGGHTFMGRGHNNVEGDAMTIARGKVHAAEEAEKDALKMLAVARAAVAEANEHVDRLYQEAEEDARRAAQKQQDVAGLRNDTQHLGHSF